MISARSGSGPAARLRLWNGQTRWVLVLGARPAGTIGEPPRLLAGAPSRWVTCYRLCGRIGTDDGPAGPSELPDGQSVWDPAVFRP